jgi:hypothetical protein
MPSTFNTDTSILPIPENVKRIIFKLMGGGGGGEYVNRTTGQANPGQSGTATTFLGMSAGGGTGGGIGGRQLAGDAGVASTGNFDFSNPVSPGTSVVLSDGLAGQVNAGGNAGGIILNDQGNPRNVGDGGQGTSDQVAYISSIRHIFRNSPPWAVGNLETSADINVDVVNPQITGMPCGALWYSRFYRINFEFPFDDTSYQISILPPGPNLTAAGGSFSGYAQFNTANTPIEPKTVDSVGVWWCKYRIQGGGTVNSYVRNFTISVTGRRSSLKGMGGGGGGYIEGVIDRPDLEDRGLLDTITSLSIATGLMSMSTNTVSVASSNNPPLPSAYKR